MFDSVRNSKRLVQIILLLLILPFALWGVESYLRDTGGAGNVAEVGGTPITRAEFGQAMREQQERLRGAQGGNPALLDTPEMRRALLDSLINQRLLLIEASKARLTVGDEALRQVIASIPALQENGKFSMSRYEAALKAQGLTREGFEAQLRQDLGLQQISAAVAESSFLSGTVAERLLSIQLQARDVTESVMRVEHYMPQAKLAADAVGKHYEANRKAFEVPEQVRAEYLLLSQEAMMAQLRISDDEIKAYYDSRADSYKQPEERRASHILISSAGASDEDKAKARAKAEGILKQLRENSREFDKLARQHSQDPGSASRGGDLGFFGRGMMVKPFEDAAYGLKENEISGLVQSDFGFHIIRLTAIRGERARPLAEVREEIEAELKRQKAAKQFAEMAEGFSNLVYEQADSLKPAAEKYKLAIQQTGWMERKGKAELAILNNEKLREALFTDDALKNRRNTEAVEVAQNTLVAARVLEHKPAAVRPLEEVRVAIETRLRADEAARLARLEGERLLAALQKGEEAGVKWGPVRKLTRQGLPGMAPQSVQAVFRAGTGKLPVYVGTDLPGSAGYALYRIDAVHPGQPQGEAQRKAFRQQLAALTGEEDFGLYLQILRKRYKVSVNESALEAKDRP